MQDVTEHERDTFEFEEFFSEFWRKKPLFVRGGAADMLGRTWSADDFAKLRAKALEQDSSVMEREGEVTFIEGVSAFDPDLDELAQRFSGIFGVPRAWFDSIQTYSPSGIGAHFDHSDNFVLQQGGVKEWSLASPSHIKRGDIARRMMNLPGVGGHTLPDDDQLRFQVRQGDLLYIPMFWLHSGISQADSLSLSLVCPAVSLQSAVLPFLTRIMKSRGLGYQPVPAFHSYLSPEDAEEAEESLRKAVRTLLARISEDDVVDMVMKLQSEHLIKKF